MVIENVICIKSNNLLNPATKKSPAVFRQPGFFITLNEQTHKSRADTQVCPYVGANPWVRPNALLH